MSGKAKQSRDADREREGGRVCCVELPLKKSTKINTKTSACKAFPRAFCVERKHADRGPCGFRTDKGEKNRTIQRSVGILG